MLLPFFFGGGGSFNMVINGELQNVRYLENGWS